MADIIKIGNVELTNDEAYELYSGKKYIVTYSRIYQLHFSQANGTVYGREMFYQKGLAKRGRWHAMTAESVNNLLGFNLLNVDI